MKNQNDLPREEFMIDSIFFDEYTVTEAYGPVTIKKLGRCKIYVYGKEGKIPHFHLISDNGEFETCICITQPKYFLHGSKTDKLTRVQREQLNDFLKTQTPKMPNSTIFQAIVFAWNFANEDNMPIPFDTKQPNYCIMTDSIK